MFHKQVSRYPFGKGINYYFTYIIITSKWLVLPKILCQKVLIEPNLSRNISSKYLVPPKILHRKTLYEPISPQRGQFDYKILHQYGHTNTYHLLDSYTESIVQSPSLF